MKKAAKNRESNISYIDIDVWNKVMNRFFSILINGFKKIDNIHKSTRFNDSIKYDDFFSVVVINLSVCKMIRTLFHINEIIRCPLVYLDNCLQWKFTICN